MAFGFGFGTLPKAPGTWGWLVALPVHSTVADAADWGYWLMLGLTMLFAYWLCGKVASEDLNVHDHEGRSLGRDGRYVDHPLAGAGGLAGRGCCSEFDVPPDGHRQSPGRSTGSTATCAGGVAWCLDDLLAGVFAWLAMQALVWALA